MAKKLCLSILVVLFFLISIVPSVLAVTQKDIIGVYDIVSWISRYDNGVIVYSSETTGLYGRGVITDTMIIFSMRYVHSSYTYVDSDFGTYTFGTDKINLYGKVFGYQSMPYIFSSPDMTLNHRSHDAYYNYRTTTVYLKKTNSVYTQADINSITQEKDAIIAQKNQTISNLNSTISSMYNQEQFDQAVNDIAATKDVIIAAREQTISDKNNQISAMSDLNGDNKLDLIDIIFGLQVLSGNR